MEWARTSKSVLRAAIVTSRRATTPEQRHSEADALCSLIPTVVRAGQTVCAYVPVGSEPGSIALLDAIVAVGARVLLPVSRNDPSGVPLPLAWGEYAAGSLVDAEFGLREPPPPHSPPGTVAAASVVLVPTLAVDRTGVRLGRGAGFYDRSLRLADPEAWLVAVVRDDELIDSLPAEDHDVPMTHVLTPGRGLVRCRRRAAPASD